jgi:hypothetical protein
MSGQHAYLAMILAAFATFVGTLGGVSAYAWLKRG